MEGNENKKRENTKEKTRGRKRMCRIGEGGWLTYGRGLITSLPQKYLVFNYHSTLKVPPIFHLAL